jgi:hypothetical protein
VNGLLTDLYELTMAAGFFEAGKAGQEATFELSIRRLPRNRNYVIAAGLGQAIEYLLHLRFTAEEVAWLRGLAAFAGARRPFSTTCAVSIHRHVFAVPKEPCCSRKPVLTVRAPIIRRRSGDLPALGHHVPDAGGDQGLAVAWKWRAGGRWWSSARAGRTPGSGRDGGAGGLPGRLRRDLNTLAGFASASR